MKNEEKLKCKGDKLQNFCQEGTHQTWRERALTTK